MTFATAAMIIGGTTVAGALISSNAASSAADTSAASAANSTALQRDIYNQTRTDQQPWRDAGTNALTQMQGTQATPWKPFTMADYTADPGYAFRLSEGLKALDRSAAARGGLLSGGALKGISRYSQDYASNEFQNAYTRYNTTQSNVLGQENTGYNRLAAIAGVGQTATSFTDTAGQQFGQTAGNNTMTAGANSATAQLYSGGSMASAFQGAGNALGRMYANQPTSPVSPGYTDVNSDPNSFGGFSLAPDWSTVSVVGGI